MSMYNLAEQLRAPLAGMTEALPLREETLKLMKAKLGPDHPDTLMSMIEPRRTAMPPLGRHARGARPLREETLKLHEGQARPRPPRHAYGV